MKCDHQIGAAVGAALLPAAAEGVNGGMVGVSGDRAAIFTAALALAATAVAWHAAHPASDRKTRTRAAG